MIARAQRALVTSLKSAEPDAFRAVAIAHEGPASPADRFEVYRRSMRNRLVACLRDDYPRVRALLGERAFDELAEGYLRMYPPRDPALRNLGRDFAAFIRTTPRLGADAPLAADLAQIEWAWVEVFDAEDQRPCARADLAKVPPEAWPELRFDLSPAVRIERLAHRVDRFTVEAPDARPAREDSSLLVWRKGLRVFVRPLDDVETCALEAASGGAPFGEICARSLPDDADIESAARLILGHVGRWMDDELVTGLRISQSSA